MLDGVIVPMKLRVHDTRYLFDLEDMAISSTVQRTE